MIKLKNIQLHQKIIYLIFVVLQMSVCLFFAHQKQAFYCDEIFSYGLSNSENYAFLDKSASMKYGNNGWVTKKFYDDYVNIDKTEPFSFKAAYHNQEQDVHPPAYYMLLHMASYFTDHLSKWPGIVLNLLFLLLFDLMFIYIANNVFSDHKKSLFALALYSLTSAGLSNILFIRMYFLLTFLIMIFLALNIQIMKNKQIKIRDFLLLFGLLVVGGLTHYYFYVFAFVISLSVGLGFLHRKQITDTFWYGSALLLGFIFNINVFPATVSQIFTKDRGEEVIFKISRLGRFWIGKYINFINYYMTGALFYFLIFIAMLILFYKIFSIKKENIKNSCSEFLLLCQKNIIFCYIVYTYIFTSLIVIAISWDLPRFVYPTYPLIAIIIIKMFYWVLNNIGCKKLKHLYAVIFVISCVFLSINIKGIDYQYPEFKRTQERLEKLKNDDVLLYYNGKAIEHYYTSYQLKLLPDEIFYFSEKDIVNLPAILKERRTENKLVVVLPGFVKYKKQLLKDILQKLNLKSYKLLHTYQRMQFYELSD